MFPAEKGEARTCSWLHNPGTARQEDRAQQSQAQGGGTAQGDDLAQDLCGALQGTEEGLVAINEQHSPGCKDECQHCRN